MNYAEHYRFEYQVWDAGYDDNAIAIDRHCIAEILLKMVLNIHNPDETYSSVI